MAPFGLVRAVLEGPRRDPRPEDFAVLDEGFAVLESEKSKSGSPSRSSSGLDGSSGELLLSPSDESDITRFRLAVLLPREPRRPRPDAFFALDAPEEPFASDSSSSLDDTTMIAFFFVVPRALRPAAPRFRPELRLDIATALDASGISSSELSDVSWLPSSNSNASTGPVGSKPTDWRRPPRLRGRRPGLTLLGTPILATICTSPQFSRALASLGRFFSGSRVSPRPHLHALALLPADGDEGEATGLDVLDPETLSCNFGSVLFLRRRFRRPRAWRCCRRKRSPLGVPPTPMSKRSKRL